MIFPVYSIWATFTRPPPFWKFMRLYPDLDDNIRRVDLLIKKKERKESERDVLYTVTRMVELDGSADSLEV